MLNMRHYAAHITAACDALRDVVDEIDEVDALKYAAMGLSHAFFYQGYRHVLEERLENLMVVESREV